MDTSPGPPACRIRITVMLGKIKLKTESVYKLAGQKQGKPWTNPYSSGSFFNPSVFLFLAFSLKRLINNPDLKSWLSIHHELVYILKAVMHSTHGHTSLSTISVIDMDLHTTFFFLWEPMDLIW